MINKKKFSVTAIGNAMLDVLCEVPDRFLSKESISKGAMNLVSRERSNYILNMSDYKKEDWCVTWDALYYNFIHTHQAYLRKNYSWARHVSFWNKKSEIERNNILKISKQFIKKII